MERRRFVPWSDRLESRVVLSSFARTSVGLVNTEVPLSTLAQRMQRIDRLGVFLQTIDPRASVPAGPVVAELQTDLRLLLGTMRAAPRNGIVAMNQTLRGVVKQQTVSQAQAAQLNDTFGKILVASGANPAVVQSLQSSMNELTRLTTAAETDNGSLVANEYALVLQLALAVGKPLPAPGAPRLARSDDTPPRGDNRTTNPQPTLAGNYEPFTTVQILASGTGDVVGSAAVAHTGQYRVQFAAPLPPGTYTVRLRAMGPQGAISLLSRPFRFTVVAATPRGPRALMR